MGKLIQTVDTGADLTIITATGKVTVDEVIAAMEAYYMGIPTRSLLYDFQKTDTSQVTTEDLRRIAHSAKRTTHSRKNARTAIVVSSESAFGLGRMLETFMELEQMPVAFNIFKDRDEAMKWVLASESEAL